MTGAELRQSFLNYFVERDHTKMPSSSLVPTGDSTLLFTNAGMVQFKSIFTGDETLPFKRAVTAQKCLRVSGKHNDLENVGHTARHHTFFEMLGNFSFGDYFKTEAIAFGWEFLTQVVGLNKADLHVTIYKDDDEAYGIWRKVLGSGANPIGRLGEKDNFWTMGDTGPCGPCSEIHIDQGPTFGCGSPDCSPECDCDRFLELWNLVFMQYERDAAGNMTALPRPSIDTGLGLERLAAVAQGKSSNWESDLFVPIISKIKDLANKRQSSASDTIAVRVIADHSRAAAFLIADGILPSNEGRGYVLRRILRRALRYGKYIGLNKPFLFDAAGVVINHMSGAYPELNSHAALISKVIRTEEERFLETLARGITLFEEEAGRIKHSGSNTVPGDVVFKLYDTFGFPPDLTSDMAKESGLFIDQEGFDREMAKQKQLARQSWEGMHEADNEVLKNLAHNGIHSEFTGYETLEDSGLVLAIVKDGATVDEAKPGDKIEIITNRTPFYAESGGQVGDHGIISGNGSEIEVSSTSKLSPNLIVHKGFIKSGAIRVNDEVVLKVSPDLRKSIMANHSATHILQWALRKVLGDHVKQSGSLVESSRLRFDFTHFSAISPLKLTSIEDLVNSRILENTPVHAEIMSIDEAMQRGAMALFGEKYGAEVRMITIGDFSRELCGGTHTNRTGDIGLFKIIAEGGIAAGVRRIEAVTGTSAVAYVQSLEEELRELADKLKGPRGELSRKLDKLLEEKKSREKEIEVLKAKLASGGATDILAGIREVNGIKVITRVVEDISNPKDFREFADRLKDTLQSGVALLGAEADGKALLLAIVTKDLTKRFHAGNIVKAAAGVVGGSGGGRPDMAQAGGSNPEALANAVKILDDYIASN